MKRSIRALIALSLPALFLFGGCAPTTADSLIRPTSFVEEDVYPFACETVKNRLRTGLAQQKDDAFMFYGDFVEIQNGGEAFECGRFIHEGSLMGGADAVILLEEPNYGRTHLTIYQPGRTNATTDLARAIKEIAGGEQ
ncbi:hypothetical protein LJC23_02150 [Desulfovibrio sp. OttesenSCG-928-I05]|nr:hypothetical protein [Desulfovibrio sp. OttesenSCG-928-I05]